VNLAIHLGYAIPFFCFPVMVLLHRFEGKEDNVIVTTHAEPFAILAIGAGLGMLANWISLGIKTKSDGRYA